MTGKTHIAIGIAAGLTISSDLPVEQQLILIGASVIGSLFPDLDHPKAKLNQKLLLFNNNFYRVIFYLFLSSIFMFLYFFIKSSFFGLLAIITFLIGLSNHRGFTHSIFGFLICAYIVKIGSIEYGLPSVYSGFTIGYILHLIADFFTPQGIKLFYPLKSNVSAPITITTNSAKERMLFTVLSIYTVVLLFRFVKI